MSAAVLAFDTTAPARTYGRLAFDAAGGKWVLTDVPPHVAIRLKSIFPRLPKAQAETFTLAHTPDTCADLQWFAERYPLAMAPADRMALIAGKTLFERDVAAVEAILLPDWTPPPFTGFRDGLAPYGYQAQGIEITRKLRRMLIGDDVGLGKTVTALGAVAVPEFLPAAVIVPPHLTAQWQRYAERFTHLRVHVIAGTKPYDLPAADLYVFRYSNIAGWVDIAATGMFRSVILDEIHAMRKGPSTAKGKAATVFATHATGLRIGLSATPVYNYGGEIFPIVELIAPGTLGDLADFHREWCTSRGQGNWIVKDPDALGTYLRDQNLLLRRVRSGKPVNTIVHEVPYDADVAADAASLARALAIKVTTGSFMERGQAARELDALTRQVTGVAKARHVAAYVRMLLDDGIPVLLAGWHREVYDIWNRELAAYDPAMFTGTESVARKEREKNRFIAGETPLLIISLRSGEGLDGLQARAATVVIGELDWSPKVHEQVIGRLDRPGQGADEVTAIYLHTDEGSDPVIMEILGVKGSQARGITDPMAGVVQVHSDESRIRRLAERYLAAGPA